MRIGDVSFWYADIGLPYRRAPLEGDGVMNPDVYCRLRDEEVARLRAAMGTPDRRFDEAVELLDTLVLGTEFAPFLTLPAYERLD